LTIAGISGNYSVGLAFPAWQAFGLNTSVTRFREKVLPHFVKQHIVEPQFVKPQFVEPQFVEPQFVEPQFVEL
jgi:hypothetical protein